MKAISSAFSEKGGYSAQFVSDGSTLSHDVAIGE